MDPSRKQTTEQGPVRHRGRPPKLSQEQLERVRELVREHPNATIDELRQGLHRRTGVQISRLTMYRSLQRAGLQRPKRSGPPAQPQPLAGHNSASPPPGPPKPLMRYGYTARHRDPGSATRYPGGLTDAEWELVQDLFPSPTGGKPPKYPRRLVVDACCYVLRSGCPWRMLPKDFPPWQNVYAHFRRWTAKGLFETMHDRLRAQWRQRQGKDPNPTAAVLDTQSIKTSAQGGPKGYDAGKKVKGRKRHLMVDLMGLLLAVLVLPANVQDRDGAAPLAARGMAKYPTLQKLFADPAYTGDWSEALRDTYGVEVELVRRPPKAGSWAESTGPPAPAPAPATPFPIVPKRWVVERTNSWVERPRRLSKDYDRLPEVSASWIWLAEARLLLRRLTDPADG